MPTPVLTAGCFSRVLFSCSWSWSIVLPATHPIPSHGKMFAVTRLSGQLKTIPTMQYFGISFLFQDVSILFVIVRKVIVQGTSAVCNLSYPMIFF